MVTNYLKPQSPLKKIDSESGDINYLYPMTTLDQIVMEDGSRLNTNLIYYSNGGEDATEIINADTLGGYTLKEIITLITEMPSGDEVEY